jgi:hypothetical protein
MSPVAHLVGSWLVAVAATDNARDRKLVTLAGVIPDADGLGILVDWTRAALSGEPATYNWYQQHHHLLLHGWPGALAVAVALTCFANKRWRTLVLCLLVFHLHLLCDLLGSRGPSPGDLWPISYGEPLFRHPIWIWRGQWKLDGWQNQSIFLVLFAASVWVAIRKGCSFVELFGKRADAAFVATLRKWKAGFGGAS